MQFIREAFVLFGTHPRLWRYTLKPLAWTVLVYILLLAIGYFALVPPLQSFAQDILGPGLGQTVALILFFAAWLVLSSALFMSTLSILSGLLWSELAAEVEGICFGRSESIDLPLARRIQDSVQRGLLSLLLGVVATVSTLCIPLVGPLLSASYLSLLDYTAPAYERRGMLLNQQRQAVRKIPARWNFAACAGLLSMVPLINIILLPLLVTAGTLLVNSVEPGRIPND